MASGIDVKMGVSGVSQFKSAMNQSSQSVKTLDAALKLNEKQLQATGDKETYMAQKSKLLQQQIAAQTNVVRQGQQALQAMEKNGVDPASSAYQKLQQQVLNAQTALLGMQTGLSGVGQTATQTATQTDKLATSLNGINKKVSFDAVIGGIGKITSAMETAARKVASMATDVWNTMSAAASWADSENTLAAMYGVDVETLQKMQSAARTIDTSVETIIHSRQRLKMNMAGGSQEITEAFQELGVAFTETVGQGKYGAVQAARDWEDVFWDLGDALMHYEGAMDRDVLAQRIFGKSWMELMPLFSAGRDEYEAAMNAHSVVTQENVDKLNALDDALQGLQQEFETLKTTVLASFAPALTALADSVSTALQTFNEYLKSDEGKAKLEALGDAAEKLFSGITDADLETALDTLISGLDSITGALEWLGDPGNKDKVVTALKAIGVAFVGLKAAELAFQLTQAASAIKTIMSFGGTSSAASSAANPVTLGLLLVPPMYDFATNPGKYMDVDPQYKAAAEAMEAVAESAPNALAASSDVQKAGRRRLWDRIFGGGTQAASQNTAKADAEDYTYTPHRDENGNTVGTGGRRKVITGVATGAERSIDQVLADMAQAEADVLANREADMETMYAEAARRAEEIEEAYQARMEAAGNAPSWAEITGQPAPAESPEDKLARMFGFTDDQGIIDAYNSVTEQIAKNKEAGSPFALDDALDLFGLTGDDLTALSKMAWDARIRIEEAEAEAQAAEKAAAEFAEKSKRWSGEYWTSEAGLRETFGLTDDQSVVDKYEEIMNGLLGMSSVTDIMDYLWEQYGTTLAEYQALGRMAEEARDRLGTEGIGGEGAGGGGMPVQATPVFDEDVGSELQAQLSGVTLHVTVLPDFGGMLDGIHANGLPFVPFDGYIAALHRGERVVPANQNKSYTTNSNVYFDHVNVGGGVDADGLAARIAERTRRTMAGFGG